MNEGAKDRHLLQLLLELARHADPDPWRNRFRQLDVWGNLAKLGKLADELDVSRQPPHILATFGKQWAHVGGDPERLYTSALMYYPRDFWLHFELAASRRNPAEAAANYRAALAIRPKNPPTLISLGVAFYRQKKLTEAILAYKKAIELRSNDPLAHNNLGAALAEQRQPEAALAALQKAIELDSNHALAYQNLAALLRRQKKLPEAIAAMEKAIALDSTRASAYSGLGLALHDQKKHVEAVAACQKAIAIDPKYAGAYTNLGLAHLWPEEVARGRCRLAEGHRTRSEKRRALQRPRLSVSCAGEVFGSHRLLPESN